MQTQTDERPGAMSGETAPESEERPPENFSGGSVLDYVDTETFVFPVSIRPDAPENRRTTFGDTDTFHELQKQAVCRDIEIMDDIVRARLRGYREEEMRIRGLPIDSPVAEYGDERDEMPGLEEVDQASARNAKLDVIMTGQAMGGMSFVQPTVAHDSNPAVSTTTSCTTTSAVVASEDDGHEAVDTIAFVVDEEGRRVAVSNKVRQASLTGNTDPAGQAFSFTPQQMAEIASHIPRSVLIETGYSEKAHRAYLDHQALRLREKMLMMDLLSFGSQHSETKFSKNDLRNLPPPTTDYVESASDDDSIPDLVKPGAPEDISPSPPVHANEPVKKNLDSWDTSVLLDCNADDSEGQGRGVTYTYDEEGRPVPVVNVGQTKTRWSAHLNSVFPVSSNGSKTESEKKHGPTDAVNDVCRGQPVTITTHDLKAMLLLSMAKASHFATVREMNEVLKSEADWFNSGQSLTVYLPK